MGTLHIHHKSLAVKWPYLFSMYIYVIYINILQHTTRSTSSKKKSLKRDWLWWGRSAMLENRLCHAIGQAEALEERSNWSSGATPSPNHCNGVNKTQKKNFVRSIYPSQPHLTLSPEYKMKRYCSSDQITRIGWRFLASSSSSSFPCCYCWTFEYVDMLRYWRNFNFLLLLCWFW